jgi:hypothetical protein
LLDCLIAFFYSCWNRKHVENDESSKLLRDLDESAVNVAGKSNPGLRLLDACIEDLADARYLLNSKRPEDQEIRNKAAASKSEYTK